MRQFEKPSSFAFKSFFANTLNMTSHDFELMFVVLTRGDEQRRHNARRAKQWRRATQAQITVENN